MGRTVARPGGEQPKRLQPVAAAWDPAKHPRNPAGHTGGGRFRSALARAHELLQILGDDVPEAMQHQVIDGLAVQAELTPRTMSRLGGVNLLEWGTPISDTYQQLYGRSSAFYAPRDGEIWLHPAWAHPTRPHALQDHVTRTRERGWLTPTGAGTALGGTIGHEYGHHVAAQFMPSQTGMDAATAERFLPTVTQALGLGETTASLLGSGDVARARLDAWVAGHAEQIRALVSEYGSKSFGEMLAEIWQEFSTMGEQARPHIRQIGELMRELAEGSEPR